MWITISFIIETTGGISSAVEKFLEELFIWIYKCEGQEGKKTEKDLKDCIAIAVHTYKEVMPFWTGHMSSVIRSSNCWMNCEAT